ncbi:uncharacterized protein SNRPG isoform X1 [Procambarus clarkii]|uniref:uncharacterized protein SNRPG isoform X1 n=1 Tax=Procambarus clarkii TaxID=6728 RepID=UPI0037443B98
MLKKNDDRVLKTIAAKVDLTKKMNHNVSLSRTKCTDIDNCLSRRLSECVLEVKSVSVVDGRRRGRGRGSKLPAVGPPATPPPGATTRKASPNASSAVDAAHRSPGVVTISPTPAREIKHHTRRSFRLFAGPTKPSSSGHQKASSAVSTGPAPHLRRRYVTKFNFAPYMDKRVTTKLNGGRVVEGTLRGFDPFMNLVVDDGVEIRKTGDRVRIGVVVIRGSSIIMLEALDRIS